MLVVAIIQLLFTLKMAVRGFSVTTYMFVAFLIPIGLIIYVLSIGFTSKVLKTPFTGPVWLFFFLSCAVIFQNVLELKDNKTL